MDQDDRGAIAGDPVDHPVPVQPDLPLVEEEVLHGLTLRDGLASLAGRREARWRLHKTGRQSLAAGLTNRPRQDGQGYVSGALLGGYVVEPGDGRRLAANAWIL